MGDDLHFFLQIEDYLIFSKWKMIQMFFWVEDDLQNGRKKINAFDLWYQINPKKVYMSKILEPYLTKWYLQGKKVCPPLQQIIKV